MMIGDNAYVRYVLSGKQGKLPIEKQVLETVFDGHHYTLTLEVSGKEPDGAEIKKYRDIAYALAGAIKYTKPAGATEKPPATGPVPTPEK
jgi:hypothetical protein